MTFLLTALLVASLATFAGAHVALLVGLVRLRAKAWRVVVALLVPPLVPWWGWELGMNRRVLAWLGALALYALGVALV